MAVWSICWLTKPTLLQNSGSSTETSVPPTVTAKCACENVEPASAVDSNCLTLAERCSSSSMSSSQNLEAVSSACSAPYAPWRSSEAISLALIFFDLSLSIPESTCKGGWEGWGQGRMGRRRPRSGRRGRPRAHRLVERELSFAFISMH